MPHDLGNKSIGAQAGGMVELAKEDQKISLYINRDAVGSAGLTIQDQMLKLARLVSGKEKS